MDIELASRRLAPALQAGDTVQLQLEGEEEYYPELLVVKNGKVPGTYHFSTKRGNLRIIDGEVNGLGAEGAFATWFLEYHPSGSISMFPLAHRGKINEAGGKNWYLGFKNGKWIGNAGNDSCGKVLVHFISRNSQTLVQEATPTINAPPFMDLPNELKEQFVQKGYLIFSNLIPHEVVQNAMRRINHAMGSPDYNTQGEKPEFSDTIRASHDIMVPFTYCSNITKSLLGENNVQTPHIGQIALRFPSLKKEEDLTKNRWHVDGLNKVAEGKFYPFSLLVGVALSDQSQIGKGNLRVFPGSQHILRDPYREAVTNRTSLNMKMDVGQEEHILLKPGDVVVVHPLVAHGVGKVFTSDIRYQIFYRVSHKTHNSNIGLLNDLFYEYEGLHARINK